MERCEGGSCKVDARACPKDHRHRPPFRSEISAGRALLADGPGRGVESHIPRGACCEGHHHSTLIPNPFPQPDTELPKQPKLTATRKTAKPKKPEPKSTADPKLLGSPRRKRPRVSKPPLPNPQPLDQVVPTQSSASPLDDISDLFDHLPSQVCLEMTRRLLMSISLPTGAARQRAVLKTVILFVAEYGNTP